MKTKDTLDHFIEAIGESAFHGEMGLNESQIFSLAEWALIASEQLNQAKELKYHMGEVDRLVEAMNNKTTEVMDRIEKPKRTTKKKA